MFNLDNAGSVGLAAHHRCIAWQGRLMTIAAMRVMLSNMGPLGASSSLATAQDELRCHQILMRA